ncbi:ATP-dependent RNA helicase MRH4, mitochondrial [Phlyctema vagabunda]|uniref:RNA helicase n=1 Tax=Phlyctema vagabunda TaxID=108571 RepID=A0ABR4P7M0_9HELO
MLRPRTARCIFCQFRPVYRSFESPIQQASKRNASTSFKPRPSRMDLSPNVGKPDAKPARRKQDGPFGGLNQTVANIRGIPERRSAQQEKRANREGGKGDRTDHRVRDGFKALKMQRALAPVSYAQRTSIKQRMADVDSFEIFPLLPKVQSAILTQGLEGMENVVPTPVQRLAIPALLGMKDGKRKPSSSEREDFLIAAETGSGKTLSYLIPTINAVKLAEQSDIEVAEYEKMKQEERLRQNTVNFAPPPLSNMPHPTTGRPRVVILVPTSELVTQVGHVLKQFGHAVKFRSAMISSAYSGQVIRNRLFSPGGIDILVSTPHLLSSIADSDPNILSRVTHLIIDEADSLLDRGFSPLTTAIIDRASPSLKQLIMCSATIPRSMDKLLRTRYMNIHRIVTPNLHAISRRVQLGVVNIEKPPYQGNKNLACADTIWSIGKAAADHVGADKNMIDVKRVLVFVNEREKTKELAEYLQTKGIDAIALNRDTPEERQSEMLASFTTRTPLSVPRPEVESGSLADNLPNYLPPGHVLPPVKRKLANMKVLVTTDLGSRGIDTLAVRNVILYDIPHSTVDFIHRLGRTGRMGRRGKGIALVGKNDRADVVAEVKEGMFHGQALI